MDLFVKTEIKVDLDSDLNSVSLKAIVENIFSERREVLIINRVTWIKKQEEHMVLFVLFERERKKVDRLYVEKPPILVASV